MVRMTSSLLNLEADEVAWENAIQKGCATNQQKYSELETELAGDEGANPSYLNSREIGRGSSGKSNN